MHPPDYWNNPGLHANVQNLAEGLAAAARIWPQQDHDPSGYNNVYNHWLIYPMDISFTSSTCNLDDEDTKAWFHEKFRDFLADYNDNCAGIVPAASCSASSRCAPASCTAAAPRPLPSTTPGLRWATTRRT